MRAALRAVVLTGGLLSATEPALAQQAVFLVRHAEKVDESDDAALSAKGAARAQALARHLAAAGVKAIYVTQYQRTAQTAQPLADRLGLTPVKLHSDASRELVERIRSDHPRDVVLIVGHSNSVPRAIRLLGHAEPVEIGHDEYDSLFVVVPRGPGPPALLRLKF
jgi:broad specificity phosphatase PhoE